MAPGSPWPLSKISVQLEEKIYATFKSVNSFTVDNPFCCRREALVSLLTTTDLTSFLQLLHEKKKKIEKRERTSEREKERNRERAGRSRRGERILMQARFRARVLSSLACCVLTFSDCNNYSGGIIFPRRLISQASGPPPDPAFLVRSNVDSSITDIHVRYRRWRWSRSRGTKLQIVLLTETNYFPSTNRGGSFRVIMYQVVPKVQGFRVRLMFRKMRGGFQRMITHRRGGAGM